jgi:8-oxo-dGTP diphosphatase
MPAATDWDGLPFGGAKIAAILGDALLVYARDDRPDIPFPGMLDLPGGGREGSETPAQCVTRELAEEFGVDLPVDRLHYHRVYALADGTTLSHFFAAYLTEDEVANVRFGDEGQDWALMPMADFIADADAVPRLRDWLGHYLAAAAQIRYLNTISENPGKA